MDEGQHNKVPVPKWRYIFTPIILYGSCILIFWFSIGRNGNTPTALLVGGAVAFAFNVMWIFQTAISSKSPGFKYIVSIKKLILMGIYSFAFLITWSIFILIIFNNK